MNIKHFSMMAFLLLVSGQVSGLQDQLLLHGSLNQLVDQAKVSGSPKSGFDGWKIEGYALTHAKSDVFYSNFTGKFQTYVNYISDPKNTKTVAIPVARHKNWAIIVDFSKSTVLIPKKNLQSVLEKSLQQEFPSEDLNDQMCELLTRMNQELPRAAEKEMKSGQDYLTNQDIPIVLLYIDDQGKGITAARFGKANTIPAEDNPGVKSDITTVACQLGTNRTKTGSRVTFGTDVSLWIEMGGVTLPIPKPALKANIVKILSEAVFNTIYGSAKASKQRREKFKEYKIVETGLMKFFSQNVSIDVAKANDMQQDQKPAVASLLDVEYPSGCLIRITPPKAS